MADRLVFDEAAAHDLVTTLQSIVRDRDVDSGHIELSSGAATAALEQFRAAVQGVGMRLDEDLDALADFLSAATAQLSRVDGDVAASVRKVHTL